MADTPTTRPTVYPAFQYRDARAAIRFLTEVLGFTQAALYQDDSGTVMHAELIQGNGLVMLGTRPEGGDSPYQRAAKDLGPSATYVVVQDPDGHHAHAAAGGAEIVIPPTDMDYGSREYTARDPEGNLWTFGTYQPDFAQH